MTKSSALAEALQNYIRNADPLGPTVDDAIKRVLQRYGREKTLAAVKAQTSLKAGRKKLPDWDDLDTVIQSDARRWLRTGTLDGRRKNTPIANEIANRAEPHKRDTIKRRIMGLLSKERDRRTAISAFILCREEAHHSKFIEAALWLRGQDDWRDYMESQILAYHDFIKAYEKIYEETPPAELTFNDLVDLVSKKNALVAASEPTVDARPKGLFGNLLEAKPTDV